MNGTMQRFARPRRGRRRPVGWALGWLGALGAAALAGAPAAPRAAAAPAAASALAPQDATYAAVRAARPDGRTAVVHGLTLDRDAFHLGFDGTFYFLAPVAGGRTVGAVFLGKGTLRLNPASAPERRQLAICAGEGKDFEVLTDTFEEMVLLFADDTAAEIGQAARIESGVPEPRARQVYERWFDRQRKDFHLNLQLRVARDLLNHPGLTSGVFLALVEGKKLSPALLAVDPDGAGSLVGGLRLGREPTLLYVADMHRGGIWYLSATRAEVDSGRRAAARPLARVLHYSVDTTVRRDTDLAGVTALRLQVLVPGLRVLPLTLTPRLRIDEAYYGALPGAATSDAAAAEPTSRVAAAVVQEDAKEDGRDVAVIFPEPLAEGSQVLLRLAYQGDMVLHDAGDKNYVVESRESWYPNLGVFEDPAPFDLTYRVPAGNQVVSVGRLVTSRQAGAQNVSEWRTDAGVRVAGFNYGQFKELERRDEASGIELQVFTNPGTPDIIRTINEIMAASGRREMAGLGVDGDIANIAPQATLGNVNTGRLAEAALTDGINGARVFTTYFGPPAENHVAITQQSQFAFGQSWPSLIFMPYISFLDSTQRQRLGMNAAKDFVDQVGFHELAHQWFGHLVAAESYRDVWLEEGFAEFAAALAVQHTQGWGAYDRIWRNARKTIFATPPHSVVANIDAGPITQGIRLATEHTPGAYQALVYYKGAYVLHMLRMLMWDGANPSPDHRFIDMMHDYLSTWSGKQASTAAFQAVVERHMVPAMDATGDGKMDWFFRQWVYGTEAPHLVSDLHLEPAGDQVHIRGTVSQQGVSDTFRTLLPLYLEFDKGQVVRVGLLPLVGTAARPVDVTVKPPKKPRGVVINAHGEVLVRD
jgi:hypothetical protein